MPLKRTTLAITFAAAANLLAATAQAQGLVVHQEAVRLNDLDLSRAAGARVALHRLRAAAARICGPLEPSGGLVWELDNPRCIQKSVRAAVADLRAPVVTAVYERRAVAPPYELASTATQDPSP